MEIKISKGQYLTDIISEFLSNAIYFKILPGTGATTRELLAERHSIIFEPNVPVIKGKRATGRLGVYEGITIDQIVDYLNSNTLYKKILVTPESFHKVKEAFQYTKYDLYKDFFLLFDECDRITRDVDFRKGITFPINDFFKFDKKAFISATALFPTDPRFEEQEFKKIVIKPTFDYAKAIELITTNNVYLTLAKVLETNPSGNYCIFLNSTSLISALVRNLNIEDESHIFCSRESVYKLKSNKLHNAQEHLTTFKKYNFFTSRFFSAVDMFPESKPTIIMITDLVNAAHSMIDPQSDAIQIIGRFRDGFEKVIHISNVDEDIRAKSPEETTAYLHGCEESYNQIQALAKSASNKGAVDTLQEALKLISYANYLNEDGSKNHFMFDNTYLEEKLKGYYSDKDNLLTAYTSLHFKPYHSHEEYPYSDEHGKLKSGIQFKQVVESVITALNNVNDQSTPYTIDNRNTVLSELAKCFPDIVHAYNILGPVELKNCYSPKQIKKAVSLKKKEDSKTNYGFLKALQDEFEDGSKDSTLNLRTRLAKIIALCKMDLRPEIKLLEEFFNLSPRITLRDKKGNEQKGFKILSCKFKR